MQSRSSPSSVSLKDGNSLICYILSRLWESWKECFCLILPSSNRTSSNHMRQNLKERSRRWRKKIRRRICVLIIPRSTSRCISFIASKLLSWLSSSLDAVTLSASFGTSCAICIIAMSSNITKKVYRHSSKALIRNILVIILSTELKFGVRIYHFLRSLKMELTYKSPTQTQANFSLITTRICLLIMGFLMRATIWRNRMGN